jgi:hypothetical protein
MKQRSKMFMKLIKLLVSKRVGFEVCNADLVDEEDVYAELLDDNLWGTDLVFIYVHYNNAHYLVYDYDTETLTQVYNLVKEGNSK